MYASFHRQLPWSFVIPAGLLDKGRTFELTQAKLLSEKAVRILET